MRRLQVFATTRSPQLYALLAVLVIGFLVRLAVAPFGEFDYDAESMRRWAVRLTEAPPWEFYEDPNFSDHLPGDLWILWGLVHVYELFSPDLHVESDTFLWLLKLVPALADVGTAVMLYLLVRQLASSTAAVVAAAVFLLNPGPIFLTSFWGQWDPVSVFFALTALWLFVTGRIAFALPALTYASLIKPQFAALLPLLALAWCLQWWKPYPMDGGHRPPTARRRVGSAAAGVLLSLVVMAAVLLPFNVGAGPIGEHSFIDRVHLAVDRWAFVTMYAFNLWAAVEPPVEYVLQPDEADWLLGWSYRIWGIIFTSAAYLVVLALYARRPEPRQLLWAAMAIMLILFVFPTRIHERYLLPALTLMTCFAILTPPFRLLYAAFSVTFVVNLWFAYYIAQNAGGLADAAAGSRFFYVYPSLLNLTMTIFVILAGAIFRDRTLGAERRVQERREEPPLVASSERTSGPR